MLFIGSAAAVMQSGIDNVASGSMFAILQSAGAGGVGASILGLGVFAATGAVVGVIAVPLLINAVRKELEEDGRCEQEEGNEKEKAD
jgi:hypothetical protein